MSAPSHPSVRLALVLGVLAIAPARGVAEEGHRPTDAAGRVLNLDFETGDLRDWTAQGEAFQGQPIEGDAVAARRTDMKSGHAGRFWVGSFERGGDRPRGTLTSATFKLDKPFARFLIGAGPRETTRLEIVKADDQAVIHRAAGDGVEDLKPVVVDLSAHVGEDVFLRLVDDDSEGWGHINFDDFTLWESKPQGETRQTLPSADAFLHAGLSPEDAARAMTGPPGFKVDLLAGEPDVVQPIAFTLDHRGRLWVVESYTYPIRLPEGQGKDRILIFEDVDGDGRFESRKVFYDKLNLASGIEVGFGGVWVGAAPQFLFIPDKDGDDAPDSEPVVLLDGWGYQDTHETLNSFNWGPDGWLYGCHGVFTHSRVGKPGTADADRVPINAGIWRYHPTKHAFEVFANGTSNPWGVDFDAEGRAFLTSCVIPHLYQVIQGGRYERQAGADFNPYSYDLITTIADHRHYLGNNPHGANGRSDLAGGGHAHAGALIYQGDAWPREYVGSILMNNIHGARLNRDLLLPAGSAFVGRHAPDFLMANDRWSQIVSLKTGPDGQMYMIDWYDENQCHLTDPVAHDRTNGRIFRVRYGDQPASSRAIDPRTVSNDDLLNLLGHPNDWQVRHARRLLQERAVAMDEAARRELAAALAAKAFDGPDAKLRLNAFWALHTVAGPDEATTLKALAAPDAAFRAWAVQLATEAGAPSGKVLDDFARMARKDGSPVVRLYLASALQRLPIAARRPILEGLVSHAEDAEDHNLPLMTWYAMEPTAGEGPEWALKLGLESKLPGILSKSVRRVAAIGTPQAFDLIVATLDQADSDPTRLTILQAVNQSLQGRRTVDMPAAWPATFKKLGASGDPDIRSQATALAVTFGDPAALASFRAILADPVKPLPARRDALTALLKARDPGLAPVLQGLLPEASLRAEALRGLAAYDDPGTATVILALYPSFTPEERRDALNTLAARVTSAKALLAAVGDGLVASKELSADLVRQMRNHKDAEVDALIAKSWGTARETTADKSRLIEKYRKILTAGYARKPDLELGRAVFARTCQQCHTLFGVGAAIGPDLSGSNRADREYLLSNVLDPSSLIGNDYLAHVVATTDGRVLTGLIKSEDQDALTLQTANELLVIPIGDVEERRPSDLSMMPGDLWTPLSDFEVRSLAAYLASPTQTPMLATPENLSGFFNGKDLTGWVGDPALWSVEDGQIVGKTPGLDHNEFLRSEMSARDFRLTFQVKLVRNEGNSGVQFRSEALPDGEMKGPQADVGADWWGKLYEENGRGLLWPKSAEAVVKPGEWNNYEIVAREGSIRTWINGEPAVVLDDPEISRRGIFGLQLHSGGATEVRFKHLKLELDPTLEPATKAE
ncbi:PVC-type heme-binding CxxCH protein [Planctomyces sp. SH-PL62]|uniref:PVC-type heme-binding CxxCH protein n=1 Tax=Planctomyces sp. SH-PL62 TaxID=1636152 RepID=UPI00078C74AF|nr:PVC-type heme-binding CxxCH protein [Planctomyces sp. SH-PL62]AMV39172.1 Cytochrome c [Planctomyces sp. SH-PL62]